MEEKYYVIEVTTNSAGTETRNLTPYTNYDTALRKFYAPLGSIGAGPTKICVMLVDADLDVLKKEKWEYIEPDVISGPIINPNPETIDPSTGYPINNG